jgi:hypothetical protein
MYLAADAWSQARWCFLFQPVEETVSQPFVCSKPLFFNFSTCTGRKRSTIPAESHTRLNWNDFCCQFFCRPVFHEIFARPWNKLVLVPTIHSQHENWIVNNATPLRAVFNPSNRYVAGYPPTALSALPGKTSSFSLDGPVTALLSTPRW